MIYRWLLIILTLIFTSVVTHAQPSEDSLPEETLDQPTARDEQAAPELKELAATPSPTPLPTPEPISIADEALLQKMPLRTKIGQMLMVGFQGQSLNSGLQEILTTVKPGSILVFGRNIDSARQISDLNISAQKLAYQHSRLPLFVAVDQEGGNVIRIKTAMPLPSALAIGETDDPSLAEKAGIATGRLLKTLGFNMNLAPVLDVADPTVKTFVGTRTYGVDPHLVAKMASSFADGLAQENVLPTGKHFPGHGGVKDDSHESTPKKNSTLEMLKANDLVPFVEMQKHFKSRWAVMLGHVAYPKIDPSGMPATYSKPIVTDLLRNDMGFQGLVVTDDLSMGGASAVKNIHERALQTIEAGADMILIAWNKKLQKQIIDAIEKAVRSGRIPKERIDLSVRRIIAAKRVYARDTVRKPSPEDLQFAVRNPVFGEIGSEAIETKFKAEPTAAELEVREYVAGKNTLIFAANNIFPNSFRQMAPKVRSRAVTLSVDRPIDVNKIMRANPLAVGVFYVSGQQVARLASKISEDVARRMILVTVEAQGVMQNASQFRHIVDTYYRHPKLGGMVAQRYFVPQAVRVPASKTNNKVATTHAQSEIASARRRQTQAP